MPITCNHDASLVDVHTDTYVWFLQVSSLSELSRTTDDTIVPGIGHHPAATMPGETRKASGNCISSCIMILVFNILKLKPNNGC